jgi:hypothetical protein
MSWLTSHALSALAIGLATSMTSCRTEAHVATSPAPAGAAAETNEESVSAVEMERIRHAMASIVELDEGWNVVRDRDHVSWAAYLRRKGPAFIGHESTLSQIIARGHYRVYSVSRKPVENTWPAHSSHLVILDMERPDAREVLGPWR